MFMGLISSIQRTSKQKVKAIREGKYSLPIAITITFWFAAIMVMPSIPFDGRVQESIFPIFAVGLFIAGMIFVSANQYVGIFMAYMLLMCLMPFSTSSYVFANFAVLYGALYLAIVVCYPKLREYKDFIYGTICCYALINVLFIVLQHYGYFWIVKPFSKAHLTGMFFNRLEVGIYLAATLPFFLRYGWKVWTIAVFIGLFVLGGMTSAICAVAVVCGYGLIASKESIEKKAALVISCLLIVIAYGSYFGFGSYAIRLKANERAAVLIAQKPVTGWGIGQGQLVFPLFLNAERLPKDQGAFYYSQIIHKAAFKDVYVKRHEMKHMFGKEAWPEIHNEFFQIALDAGLIALFLFLCTIYGHIWSFIKTRNRDIVLILSFGALLLAANSFFIFQIGRFVFLFVFVAAMIQGEFKWQES